MDDREKKITRAFEQSQKRLEIQLTAGIASDQRAIAGSGICVGAAAILCVFANAAALPIGIILGSGILVAAAMTIWYSAKQGPFNAPGHKFSDFEIEEKPEVTYIDMLQELSEFAEDQITENEDKRKAQGRNAHFGYWLAWIGIAIAVFSQTFNFDKFSP